MRFVALSIVAVAAFGTPLNADTENCTPITTAPYTIDGGGVYCLIHSLVFEQSTGSAITINANNVVLDLQGFRIVNNAGSGTTATGVAAIGRKNVTVKNGIVAKFWKGVQLFDSDTATARNYVVEHITADANFYAGIHVQGIASAIRNNRVIGTGGTTLNPNSNAWGIAVQGDGTTVMDNDIDVVRGVGSGQGVAINVGGDVFTGAAIIINNRISTADRGIWMVNADKYRDNVTVNVGTPYTGGVNAGNNN